MVEVRPGQIQLNLPPRIFKFEDLSGYSLLIS